jgi:hypothetical protein
MMVLPMMRVECSAKIAMSVLPGISATMGLLPDCDLRRRIFLDADAARIRNHGVSSRVHFME